MKEIKEAKFVSAAPLKYKHLNIELLRTEQFNVHSQIKEMVNMPFMYTISSVTEHRSVQIFNEWLWTAADSYSLIISLGSLLL